MVQWMATGQDATARSSTGQTPMVIVLKPSNYSTVDNLVVTIRRLLSHNQAVAVIPVEAPKYTWDTNSLGRLFSGRPNDLSTWVEWQSKDYFCSL